MLRNTAPENIKATLDEHAQHSQCAKRKVACVIEWDIHKAIGVNTIRERDLHKVPIDPNSKEYKEFSNTHIIHAEMVAIFHAYRCIPRYEFHNAQVYINHYPCINCAKHLSYLGLINLNIYPNELRDIQYLLDLGFKVNLTL